MIGSLPAHIEFETFELIDVFGSGERFAALVEERYIAKRTGRAVEQKILFTYRVVDDQVVEYEEFGDSAQIQAAFEC